MASMKETGGSVALLIAAVLMIWGFFVMDPGSLSSHVLLFVGMAFLLVSRLLRGPYKKSQKILDERELSVSARASSLGNVALFLYAMLVAIVSRLNPAFISVPWAMLGAIIVDFGLAALAFRIWIRNPNTEIGQSKKGRVE